MNMTLHKRKIDFRCLRNEKEKNDDRKGKPTDDDKFFKKNHGRERRTHIRKPRNKKRKTKTTAHTRTIQNNYKNVEDPSLKRTPYVHSRFSKGQKRQHKNQKPQKRHHKVHVERKDQVFDDHKYHLVIPHNYTISGNAYAMDLQKGDNGFDNLMTPTINTFTTGADLSLGHEIEEALHPHVSRYVSPEPSFENEHLHHNDEGYLHHMQHNEEKFSRENDEDREHNSERLHHHVESYPHHMDNDEENFSHHHEDHNGEHLHHHVEGYPHRIHNDDEENFARHNEERQDHDNEHLHHHEESYPHHEEESKYHDKERVHHDEGNHFHNDGDKRQGHPATRRQCCPIGFEPHCCPHINTHLIEHYDIKETTLKHMQPNGCCMSGFQSSCCPIEVVEMPHGLMKSEPQGGCCMKEMENQCCAFESAPEQNYNFPLHPINITETPPNIEDTQKDMYPPPSSSGELINHGSLSGETTLIQEHESSARHTHPPIHELESGFPDAGKPSHNMKEGSYSKESSKESEEHHHDAPYKEGPHETPTEETHHSFSKEHHDENEGSKEFKKVHETNEKNFDDYEHSDKSHSSNFEENQKSHPVEEMKHHEESHVTPFSKDDQEDHLDSSHGLANEKDHGAHTEGFQGSSSEESHSGSKEPYSEESHSDSKEPHPDESHSDSKEPYPEESHSDSKGPHFEEFYNDSKEKNPEESHESHLEKSKSHSKDSSTSKSEKSKEDSSKGSDESHLDNHESSKLESDNHQEPCHEDEGAKCAKETSSHSDDSPHEPPSSLHSEEPIGKPSGEPSAFHAEGANDKLPGESHPDGDHKSHMEDLREPCHEESHEPCAKDSKMSFHDEPNHENPSEGDTTNFEGATKGTHSSSSESHPDESHASSSPDSHESPPRESHAAHSEKSEESHESHSEDSSARHPEESNESHPEESHKSLSEDSHEPHPDYSSASHSKESHDSNPMESQATHSEGSHESHSEGPTHSEGSLKPQSEESHSTSSEESHESPPDGEHAALTEKSNESHLTETKTATSKNSQESPLDESREALSEDSVKSSSEEFHVHVVSSKDSQESPQEESHEAHSEDSLESHSEKSKESQESLEGFLHALQSSNPTDSSPKEPEKENPEGSQANHNDSKNDSSEKTLTEEPKHSPAEGPSDVKEFSTDSQTTPVSIKEAENTTDEHAQCRANDEHCERSYPITPKVSFDLEGSFAATTVHAHPVDSGIHDIKSGDHGMGPERGGSAAHQEIVEEHECTNPIPAGPCKSLEEPPIHEENPGYPLYHIPKSKDCAPVEVVNRPCPPAFGCNPYEVLTSSALNGTAFLTDQFPCAPPHEHHVEDEHLVPATSFQSPHNEEMPHHNELHPPMIAPNHPPLEPPHSDAPIHHDEHHMEGKCPHHEKCAESAVHPLAESTLTIHEDFKCHNGNDCHESEPVHTSSNYHEIQPPIDHKCHMGEGCNEFESRPMHYDDHRAGNNVPMTLPIPSTSLHHVNTPLTWMADTVQNPSLHKPTTIVPITYSARSPPPSAPKLKYLVTLKNLHSKNSVPIEPEKRPLKITLNDDMKSDLRYDVSLKNAHTKDLVPHKKSLKKLKAKEAKSVKRKLIDKKKRPTISRRDIGATDEMKTTKDLGISQTTSNRFRRSVTTTPRRELKQVRNKKRTKKGKLALLRSSVFKKRNGNTILPPEIAKIKVNSSKESEKNHSTAIAPQPVEPGYTGVGPLKGGGKSYESLTSSGPTESSEKTNQVTDTPSKNVKQVTKPPEEKGKEEGKGAEGKDEEVQPTLPPSRLNNEKDEEKEAGGYTGQGPDRGGYSANAQPTPPETTPLTNPAKDETSPVVDSKINEYVGYGPNRGGYTPVTDPPLLADFSKPEEPTQSQLKVSKNTEASIEGKGGEEGPKTESKGDPKVEGKLEAKVDSEGDPKVEGKLEAKVNSNQWISMDAKPTAKEQDIRPIEAKIVSKVEPKVEDKLEAKVDSNQWISMDAKPTAKEQDIRPIEAKIVSKVEPEVEGKLEAKVDSNQWISMDAKTTAKEQEIRPIEAKSVSNFLNFSPLDTNEQKPKETEDGATLNSLVEVIENITDEQTQEIKSELHSPTTDEDNSKEEEENKVHEQRQMAIGAPIHSSPVHLTTGTAQHIAITSPPVRYNQPHAMLTPHNNEGLSSEMKWHDLNNAKINNAVSAQEVQNGKLAQQLSSQEAKNEHCCLPLMHEEDNKKLLGAVQAHLGENKHLAGRLKENQMENQKLNEELKAQKERNERLANALHVAKIQNHEQMVKIKETARPPPEIKQEKNTAGLTGGGSLTSEPRLNNIVILSGSSDKLQGGAAVSTPQTLYSLLPPPSIKQPVIEGKVERQLNDTPVKPALPPDHGTNPYEVLTSTELAGSPFKAKSEVIPKLLSSSRDAIISDVQRMMNDTAEQQEEMMYKTPKLKKRERPLNVLEKRNKQIEKIIRKRKKKKKG